MRLAICRVTFTSSCTPPRGAMVMRRSRRAIAPDPRCNRGPAPSHNSSPACGRAPPHNCDSCYAMEQAVYRVKTRCERSAAPSHNVSSTCIWPSSSAMAARSSSARARASACRARRRPTPQPAVPTDAVSADGPSGPSVCGLSSQLTLPTVSTVPAAPPAAPRRLRMLESLYETPCALP